MASAYLPDHTVLATAVVDSLVVASDPFAAVANRTYLDRARPWIDAVVAAVMTSDGAAIRTLGERLIVEPTASAPYADLRAALLAADETRPSVAALFRLAWRAECNSRLGYHLGADHKAGAVPVTAQELSAFPPGARLASDADPEVLVVVPFRDRDTDGVRLRNLLACLLALRDQSFPRERYRVTVVESDAAPRWRDVITPFADHYLFAPKAGPFNKSWAVNAGVVNTPGTSELICLLDADCLVDREHISRNVARFQRPGAGGHLSYRNLTSLDEDSAAAAIRDRLHRRAAEADPGRLRGFLVRRPPGAALWVRSEPFHRIGGFDERYEGWGGEDNDFFFRYDLAAPFDIYDDRLLHLHHPAAPTVTVDGEKANARIAWLSWRPTQPIGRLDRFAAEGNPRAEPSR